MSVALSPADLTRLMAHALRCGDANSMRLALRCCQVMGQSPQAHLVAALDQVPLRKSYLRASFEWGARYGLAGAMETLAHDAREAVAYAAGHGREEARSVERAVAQGRPPEDVRAWAALGTQPGLTMREWSMASVVLGRWLIGAEEALRTLRNDAPLALSEAFSALAAEGVTGPGVFARVAREGLDEPGEPFLLALACVGDIEAEQALLDIASRFADSAAVSRALARANSPAALDALVQRLPRYKAEAARALHDGDRPLVVQALLRAYEQPGHVRRHEAMLLASFAQADAIWPLVRALEDPLRIVRDGAVQALATLGAEGVNRLAWWFSHCDGTLRLDALRAVMRLPSATANPLLPRLWFHTSGYRDTRSLFMWMARRVAGPGAPSTLGDEGVATAAADLLARSFGSGVLRGGPAPPRPAPTLACPENLETSCYFSVAAPSQVTRASTFLVELWCHPEAPDAFLDLLSRYGAAADRLRTHGPVPVEQGVTMDVELVLPGFDVEEPRATMRWEARTGVVGFSVRTSAGTTAGGHVGVARVHVGGMPVAKVHFQVEVADAAGGRADQTVSEERILSAFASYASEDRDRVLARVQGMQKVMPSLDIFLDVMRLRSGEDWAQRLNAEILSRDVLFLFWSRAASASEWVEHEWRTALASKGLDAISPVPLDSPALAPPPQELASLHFMDWSLALMKGM